MPSFALKLMMKIVLLVLTLTLLGCAGNSSLLDEVLVKETLRLETQYFCQRDFDNWQKQWTHEPFVSKMYAGKDQFINYVGWNQIEQFTRQHIAEHPEEIDIPVIANDYKIYFFGRAAYVRFVKEGNSRPVSETRLLVIEDGRWKIAGMQTIF